MSASRFPLRPRETAGRDEPEQLEQAPDGAPLILERW
jgi:hypothetical protein